jgi:hypothetical protein
MAMLTPLTFVQAQNQEATTFNAQPGVKPANTGPGASLGAIFNAAALVFMQEQGQIQYVNGVARLSTSQGLDVDSYVNPFGIFRNQATFSFNSVTYYAPVGGATSRTVIPVGAEAQTPGGVLFVVIADTTQPSWSAPDNGYVINIGGLSATVTMQAVVAGPGGNVQPGTITQPVSGAGVPSVTGIASISNAAAFVNGFPQESDQALIARFQAFFQARWGTVSSVVYGISGAQAGLTWQVGDTVDPFGNPATFFVGFVNALGQSTGPSAGLLALLYSAVDAVRPCGMPFTIVGPTLINVNVSLHVTVSAGADPTATQNAVQAAFAAFVNGIGMGNVTVTPTTMSLATTTCSYSRLLAALVAVPGVQNITAFTQNGGTADLTATYGQQLVAGSITFT